MLEVIFFSDGRLRDIFETIEKREETGRVLLCHPI